MNLFYKNMNLNYKNINLIYKNIEIKLLLHSLVYVYVKELILK